MRFRMIVLLFVFLSIYLQGCSMASSELIEEVFDTQRPKTLRPVSVDQIVEKYIPIGSSRDLAKQLLVGQGFKVVEERMTKNPDDCVDCDELFIKARYDRKQFLSISYDYGIAIQIGFRNDIAVSIHGWCVKNAL